jgi:2-dehydropantoate 2-reductase
MNIGVIGGGAIGLLFSYYLSEHHSISLYVHSKEQFDSMNEEGLLFEKNGQIIRKHISVKLISEWCGEEDVTLIAVKQYHLPNIIQLLSSFNCNNNAFLFLQNGMGHLKWFDRIKGDIYVGSIEHGAMKINANQVVHTGIGLTKIALFRGDQSKFLHFTESIDDPFFPFEMEENYEEMLLKKLVVNAVINPLTSILQIKNGELIENPHYFQIVKSLFAEIQECLHLQKPEHYFNNIIMVCEQTAKNKSSMLRDLEEKRRTEIEAILGYIVEKAIEKEIHTPIIELFYWAVKGKEFRVEE